MSIAIVVVLIGSSLNPEKVLTTVPQLLPYPRHANPPMNALKNGRAITKDADFVHSFLLNGRPYKLLLVSTGNIRNADLETVFAAHIANIVADFASNHFLELTRSGYFIRG